MVLKMVAIRYTVCMQPLHYSLSKSCICGIVRNFDSIVTIIYTCLDKGLKTNEFEYGPFWIYSVYGISNTSLDENTY